MFLKMNKHLLSYDVYEVLKFNSQWEFFFPKRPTMSEYNTNNEDNNDIEASDDYEAQRSCLLTIFDHSFS